MTLTCDTLKLVDFITCWVDKDYSVFKSEDNESAWHAIFKEYLELTENLPVLKALMIIDEIRFWKQELLIIEGCLNVLSARRDNEIVKILREKGYRFNFNEADLKEYQNDVIRVAKRAKKIVADVMDLEAQLKQLQSDNKGEEYTRQDFTNDIICLSKFMGYHIDKEKCTVAEYVSMKNAIYRHNENLGNVK